MDEDAPVAGFGSYPSMEKSFLIPERLFPGNNDTNSDTSTRPQNSLGRQASLQPITDGKPLPQPTCGHLTNSTKYPGTQEPTTAGSGLADNARPDPDAIQVIPSFRKRKKPAPDFQSPQKSPNVSQTPGFYSSLHHSLPPPISSVKVSAPAVSISQLTPHKVDSDWGGGICEDTLPPKKKNTNRTAQRRREKAAFWRNATHAGTFDRWPEPKPPQSQRSIGK